MDGSRKNVRFLTANWLYLGNGETRSRLVLIANRKCHTLCQMIKKLLTLDKFKRRYALLWLNGAR